MTVSVPDFAPAEAGLKLMVAVVQEAPEAIVLPAVQVPSPTVKSVESLLENGVDDRTTVPPLAVSVTVPQVTAPSPTPSLPQATLVGDAARLP